MLLIGISTKKSLSIIKNHPIDYINEKLALLHEKQQHKTLNNSSGFLIKAIEGNWKNEHKNGVSNGDSPITNQTKTLCIPNIKDGSQLQKWAVSNGLPEAPAGMDTYQYRQMLNNTIERMRIAREKEQINNQTSV